MNLAVLIFLKTYVCKHKSKELFEIFFNFDKRGGWNKHGGGAKVAKSLKWRLE